MPEKPFTNNQTVTLDGRTIAGETARRDTRRDSSISPPLGEPISSKVGRSATAK